MHSENGKNFNDTNAFAVYNGLIFWKKIRNKIINLTEYNDIMLNQEQDSVTFEFTTYLNYYVEGYYGNITKRINSKYI